MTHNPDFDDPQPFSALNLASFPQNGYFGRDFRLEHIGRHGLKKQVE